MDPEDEVLDLFDVNEAVVGTVKRAEYYKNLEKFTGYYLRSAELFIQNDKGELWVPRRTAHKTVAPSSLDYSCGGHVAAGEDYITGCIREAEEELGLVLKPEDLQLVAQFTPATSNYPWFRYLFVYTSNKVPPYNTDDFSEYYWLTPEALLRKLTAGEPAKQSMLETVKIFSKHST